MSNALPQPFGKYILLNKIAMGGMAEIFRAKTLGAEGFEKEVVIKRILPHFTEDEAFVTMFIDEAKVSSKLTHPNIVQIYDFDLQDGTYYIAMEYVEGKDLKRVVDLAAKGNKPLTVYQMVHVAIETCKGLHNAHTKLDRGQPLNIVHRDVSPHNVMVSYDGDVKVMDFGIAKAAARSTKTRAGTVKGKCAYMSPEQARGKNLDGRSDMFAVGVMLWEMLTGRRLFAGDSDFETLSNVLKQDAPPPSQFNPDVPPALDAVVLKCLNKERDERQADCKEFARELEGWLYSTAPDRQAGELGPYMDEVFADDIRALREMQRDDGRTQVADVHEQVRSNRTLSSTSLTGSGQRPQTGSRSNLKAVAPNDARTIALDVGAAGLNAERTVAVDAASLNLTPKKKSNAPLFVVLGVLLVGGGVGGWYWWSTQQAAQAAAAASQAQAAAVPTPVPPAPAPQPETATPPAAPVEPAPREEPKPEAAPEPVKPKVAKLTFNAIPTDATIEARGQKGTGTLSIEASAGDQIVAVVTHPDYEQVVQTERVGEVDRSVDVPLTTKKVVAAPVPVEAVAAAATMSVTVTPADAVLSINGQPQPPAAPGQFKVLGYKVGEDIEIEVTAPGYKKESEKLRITSAELTKSYALKRPVVVASGPGKVAFKAKPWAKVSVSGKSCLTSCVLELPSGKHTATFEQGGVSKRVGFTIKADQTVSVFQDMTQ